MHSEGNRPDGHPHLRLVPPLEPPRVMLRLPPGMTAEKWRATLRELGELVGELQASNARMRALNDRMLERLRGDVS